MGKLILIVEDDEMLAHNVCAFLERHGWDTHACGSAEEALQLVQTLHPHGVVADQSLPGMCGVEMTRKLLELEPQTKVIMMTGDDRANTAVQAMKAGAFDYLTKPVSLTELHLLLERAVHTQRVEQALQFYQERQAQGAGLQALVGQSPVMQALVATIKQVLDAGRRVTGGNMPAAFVHGETGTGKELVARALHFSGARHDKPFVEINCATIPPHLLEAELFGYEKGAFTDAKQSKLGLVESADGGTLFLDEIGEIDLSLQAKLLKLLEEKTIRRVGSVTERKINLSIVSATNRDLEQMVREGKFRSDLYFRLRIIFLKVPPLRDRGEDVLLLARHFLQVHGLRYTKPGLSLSPEAEQALLHYHWPGNVRELRNLLEQAVLLTGEQTIGTSQLGLGAGCAPTPYMVPAPKTEEASPLALYRQRAQFAEAEKALVAGTLERSGWNVTRSAKILGLSRDMMRYRIEKLGLVRPEQDMRDPPDLPANHATDPPPLGKNPG